MVLVEIGCNANRDTVPVSEAPAFSDPMWHLSTSVESFPPTAGIIPGTFATLPSRGFSPA
jgi:hypothetical protein